MRHNRNAHAFTLAEILTVVVIIGIASVIVIPQLGSRDDLKVSAAARRVMADLIYAQNQAITTQKMHYVRFNITSGLNNYEVLTSLSPAAYAAHPISKDDFKAMFGGGGSAGMADVRLASADFDDQTVLAFDELGTPYAYDPEVPGVAPLNAAGQLVLTNQGGEFGITIQIEPATGEITVK